MLFTINVKKKSDFSSFKNNNNKNPAYLEPHCIMVPHKRIKCPKLHPANTQFLVGVPEKSTNVSSNKGYTDELKVQYT